MVRMCVNCGGQCKGERRKGPTVCSLVQLHLTGKARERALVLVHGLLPLWDAPCPRPIGAQRDDLDLPHWQQKEGGNERWSAVSMELGGRRWSESGSVIEMGGKVVRNVTTYGRRMGHT